MYPITRFATALALTWALATPALAADQPNVIVILTDTLRADRLGTYGSPTEDVSPRFDAFAAQSTVFEQAISQGGWTIPSVASLFTGLYPSAHGVLGWNGQTKMSDILSDGHVTMAEQFQGAGYHTGAIVKTPVIQAHRGFGQGFDDYAVVDGVSGYGRSAQELTDAAITWLGASEKEAAPYFLYLHYMDPHGPYRAPKPFYDMYANPSYTGGLTGSEQAKLGRGEIPNPASHAEHMMALYDGEITYWDRQIGRLLNFLKAEGALEDTIIVFTADHGEMFFEHQHWEHDNLYAENIHIPLVVYVPGQSPQRLSGWVEQFDTGATVLDFAGIPRPSQWQARSLKPDILTGAVTPARVYSENGFSQATIVDQKKTLYFECAGKAGKGGCRAHPTKNGTHVFDLRADPDEQTDIAATLAAVKKRERQFMDTLRSENNTHRESVKQSTEALSTDEIEALRALGYLE